MTTKDKIDSITKNLKDLLSNNAATTLSSIEFDGEIVGKGLMWTGSGAIKQLIFTVNPDRLHSSESIDLAQGSSYYIDGQPVLSVDSLGGSVTKSSLTEVGILEGLLVNGSVSIDQYLYFNSHTNRLGLGTSEPNATISIVNKGTETIFDSGIVGTLTAADFAVVTENISRISVAKDGDIQLGNTKQPLIQVSVHGQLAVKVSNPDPNVDLHVNGPIKFDGHLQRYDSAPPISGYHSVGDIVWNTQPRIESYVGWVCINPGDPGRWEPFGKIGNQ